MKIKQAFKRIFLSLLVVIALIAALISIEVLGGQPMGLFSGSRPDGLGFNNGQFKPPSWKPNTVSSTVEKSDAKHYIEPISFSGDASAAWKKFISVVKSQSRATVITENKSYLYAEFKTPSMGFIDDVEAALDAKANVIHVRSASRLGVRDFDANRKRIEIIRAAFAK
jgi:uncharacterized protein (DUF1499 family)